MRGFSAVVIKHFAHSSFWSAGFRWEGCRRVENEEQARLVKDILSFAVRESVTVILESWQGNLDGVSGFKSDIGLLYRRHGADIAQSGGGRSVWPRRLDSL